MRVIEGPLAFIDVETSGMSHYDSRVIELGILRVEQGKVVQRINTLINPESYVNPYIEKITGIDISKLNSAPTFADVANNVYEILDGALFIAHNVRFDHSFIKNEFKRIGKTYRTKMLCSVRLSRALYPHYRRHGLDHVIERHNIQIANRHRAYDDAKAVWEFFKIAQMQNSVEAFEKAISAQVRQPSLPSNLQAGLAKNLPESIGVYIFEDSAGKPLYVGKSINIKKRVMSHFGGDHASTKELKISQQISNITVHKTSTELQALLLESRLVKDLQPLFNRQLRRTSKLVLASCLTTASGYQTIVLQEANTDDLLPESMQNVMAVYTTRGKARLALESYVKLYDLCPKLLGLESGKGACFLRQLKKCHGACEGVETVARHNFRLQTAFAISRIKAWPYTGAIVVSEPESDGGVIIDQWCVVGEVSQAADCDPQLSEIGRRFDLDTYKILQSYLARHKSKLRIVLLKERQLTML